MRAANVHGNTLLRLALIFMVLAGSRQASAGVFVRGKVVAVLDGDTITVLDAVRRQHRIRLYQIDAPEKGQDYGSASKKSLSGMIFGRQVSVESVTTDRYHREVGTVYLAGTDVNLEQVTRGMAWVYRKYSNDPDYLAAEQSARAGRVGLWARSKPVPPWEFRREHDDRDDSAARRWFRRFW